MKILVIGEPSNRQLEMLKELAEIYNYEVVRKTQEEFCQEQEAKQEATSVWFDECSNFVYKPPYLPVSEWWWNKDITLRRLRGPSRAETGKNLLCERGLTVEQLLDYQGEDV